MDGPRSKQRLCVRANLVVFETEPKPPDPAHVKCNIFFLLNAIGEKKRYETNR